MSATAMNDLEALNKAILDMREAGESHEKWLQHLSQGGCECCTEEVIKTAGDEKTQREWIDKYDNVLSILHARRNALRSIRRRTK